ncbi:diguanylate cyclase [Pseudorhodoferax sp. Leaf267]|nr:diguanylate cyclase [Pseudorhodoferax sp. Leaf267]
MEAVCLVDPASLLVLHANRAAAQLLRMPGEDIVGQAVQALCPAPEDAFFWADVDAGLSQAIRSDTLVRCGDGTVLHVERRVSLLHLAGGARVFLVCLQDRTPQQRLEHALDMVLAEMQATLESTADGILVSDVQGLTTACNRRFAELWNVPEALLVRRDEEALRQHMADAVRDREAYLLRLQEITAAPLAEATDLLELRSGRLLQRTTLPKQSQGHSVGRVYSFRDITQERESQQRIEQLAYTDLLTGLPNRLMLAQRIDYALRLAGRDGTGFAVLFVDLDRFKNINDSLGHQFGDRVLVEVAQRIQSCLRQVDTLCRLGGDEFVMLLHKADVAAAEMVARRVIATVAHPFEMDALQFSIGCSIGVAMHPADGASMDDLIKCADTAMYSVKDRGRGDVGFYQPQMNMQLLARMKTEHAMHQAMEAGLFELHYQPQVDLLTGRVQAMEALLRWTDAERGIVAPESFVPLAEESGYIVTIGSWVLAEAVRQAADWQRAGLAVPVSVNVSPLQFQQIDFVARVAAALHAHGLAPQLLELELTETILVRDAAEALQRLHALDALGVRLAIDDFGTGYSSLAYLKQLPIRKLKIDRSFVRGLPDDESDRAIVSAIVQMARALQLTTIAEGVETQAQLALLQALQCDQYQGYLCAPAMPAPQALLWLQRGG